LQGRRHWQGPQHRHERVRKNDHDQALLRRNHDLDGTKPAARHSQPGHAHHHYNHAHRILLLFVFVFGGAIESGADSYVNYLLPGILLITVASGISYTAFRLFLDMKNGIFERFQSMPIARSSVLWAHVLTSLVAVLMSLVVVVLVALLMGFRSGSGPLAWLAVAGILILFTLALTWIAVIPGLTAKSPDGASAFAYPLIFLPFISSAFVPTDTMPGPVRTFAEHQPVTSIVDVIRDLFTQRPVGPDIWIALAW
jgi:ABC-2 type transport system permease protein